ncbi:serine hydrolase domain-containing protein [Bailinhaonella thermotolerans]|uniref:Class A beta-lactamase-related serine hydrolase n=1 Tax=Bailinhaonella thermotolerans TaxID=1070861 RepID=A0A3A4B1W6_9ACTN|nr:serine hydrolase domain-containing protein [Bailinhaonella thermotolerans]RJL35725.1 class A beta-lactamase-related serine hydrolase [Bailinhaonella thermotolerans]
MTGNGHDKTQRILDRAVAELGIPGIVIEVKNAEGSWFGTAGVSDLTTGAPRVPGEFLPIGSGAKGITAATLLTLEAEGRVDLEDPVNKWLPGVLTNGYDGDRITIRHLLSNTGGLFATGLAPGLIGNYASRARFDEHRFDEWTREELLRLAVSEPPVGQPGERFLYANGGFYIANAIIERITGNTYAEEVRRAVIEPLGLTDTYVRGGGDTGYRGPSPRAYSTQFYKDGVDPADVTTENWESAFEEPGLEPLDVTEFNTSWETGNIVSTTSDAIRLLDALAGGTLLPPEQHREMWTTVSTEGAGWLPHTRYGLGMFELDRAVTGGLAVRGMAGSYWGHMFFALSSPDTGAAFAFHTNTEAKSWDVPFSIAEAEFGFTMSA